jgi:site-specific DNA-cytosine methylase
MPSDYTSGPATSGPTATSLNWWDSAPTQPSGIGSTAPADNIDQNPNTGRFNLNVSGPGGAYSSVQQNSNALGGLIAGIGDALFGQKTGLINSVPLVGAPLGDAVRWLTTQAPVVSQVSGAVSGAASGAFGLAEGALSRIPLGWLPGVGVDGMFDRMPDTPEKQAVAKLANADVLYGANMKYDYIRKVQEQAGTGGLFPEYSALGGSLGGLLVQVVQGLSIPGRYVERGIAGMAGPTNGLNRLAEVMKQAQTDPTKLNPTEAAVVKGYGSGGWSEQQALDYLSSHAAGYGHEGASNLLGEILLDPLTWASFGAAGLAKAGVTAAKVAEAGVEASKIGQVALAAQRSELGPIFKGIRTAIDPLSALGGGTPLGSKVVDATSTAAREEILGTAVGIHATQRFFRLVDEQMPDVAQQIRDNLAWGIDNNITREHIVGQGIDGIFRPLGGEAVPIEDIGGYARAAVDKTMTEMPNTMFQSLLTRATRVFERNVDPVDLAKRMVSVYGQDEAHWQAIINQMDDAGRSLLHMATYNAADNSLMRLIPTIAQQADTAELARLVIGNPRNLDELGAGALLKAIKAAKTPGDKFAVIKNAMDQYDNLPAMLRFDPARMEASIERALTRLQDMIDHNDLYRIMRDDEIAKYPELVQWTTEHPGWKLAFRPADESLGRPVFDAEGNLAGVNPWVGHVVGDAPWLYQPGFVLPRNIAGMADVLDGKVQRGLDWIDATLKTIRQGVSGATIKANAHVRFKSIGASEFGLTADEANTILTKIEQVAEQGARTTRSLSFTDMWNAIGGFSRDASLLPVRLQAGAARLPNQLVMTPRDLGLLVLRAYEGDLRLVGLTQKFTGRLKTMMADSPMLRDLAGGNFAGQFSEHFYQLLRFTFHPMFQAQEAMEGWILSGQRGVKPFIRGAMTAEDQKLARIWENLVNSKVIGMTDFDMAERSAFAYQGRMVAETLDGLPNSAASLALDTVGGARGIARIKRINYLRQWGSTLGKNLREITGEDFWLAMKKHYGIADDNELAVKYLSEQMDNTLANQVSKESINNYEALIADHALWKPEGFGAAQPLNLKHLAYTVGGWDSFDSMREAVRLKNASWGQIEEQLAARNASPEYIRRAKLALEFDEPQFWRDVRDAYHLTADEFRGVKSIFESNARARGMSPNEYLSGVFAPQVKMVTKAGLAGAQEVADGVNFLRAVKGLRRSGSAGAVPSQIDTLLEEMSRAARAHLDQSGKDAIAHLSDKELAQQMKAMLGGAQEPLLVSGGSASSGNIPMAPMNEPSFTIKATPGEPVRAIIGGKVKRLYARALARLQSVPDSYVLPQNEALARTIIGNGVPPKLMQAFTDPLTALLGPRPKGVTLFSGGGLAEVGIPKVDFIGAVEKNPAIAEVYKLNHGPRVVVGDVQDVNFGQWADAEYLHASPVCKNFSGAKAQAGEVELDRLTADATARAIREINPKVVTVENVPRYQGSDALKIITDQLDAVGYQWDIHVFDAADYGVPQHRNRMLLRAVRKDVGSLPALPTPVAKKAGWYDAIKDLPLPDDAAGLANWQKERLAKQGVDTTTAVTDPDVYRALSFMAKTIDDSGVLRAGSPEFRAFMAQAKDLLPGTPHNFTQELVWTAVVERLKSLEQDAYRTHYFARVRTMFERSVNHPFFGLYPASYMWGKMLPEMIRFVAKEPFGLRTGALTYTINDAYNSIAMQREMDPKFDQMMNDLGRSQAALLVSYMLPAVPWDLPAVAPQWMRAISDQGYQNMQRRQAGLAPVNIDLKAAPDAVANYLSPIPADLAKIGGTLKDIGDFVTGTPKEQKQRGGPQVSVGPVTVGGTKDNLVMPMETQLQQVTTSALDQLTKALSGK